MHNKFSDTRGANSIMEKSNDLQKTATKSDDNKEIIENKPRRYDAFISYRHIQPDMSIAKNLQKMLETFKPPKSVEYKNVNKITRIFRDESELPTSGDLGGDIKRALEQSEYLIVILSDKTEESRWCMEEINYFKELHGGNNNKILTVLVSGDPATIFPEALRFETKIITTNTGEKIETEVEIEPLATNVLAPTLSQSLKKLKTEYLRVAAPILGCSYDDLFQRHRRRAIKNAMIAGTIVSSLLVSFSAYAISNSITIADQNEALIINAKALEDKNEELELQIEETQRQTIIAQDNEALAIENMDLANEQRGIAEKNAEEARTQEAIALEQKGIAEENEAEAQRQETIATEQRDIALANEQKAKEHQLFRSVDYAEQLVVEGDRLQAASILAEAYDHFDSNSESYLDFISQLEPVMAKTSYYPDYSSYVSFQEYDSVTNVVFSQDHKIVATQSESDTVNLWNTETGDLITSLTMRADIKDMCFIGDYLATSTLTAIYYWDWTDLERAVGYTTMAISDDIINELMFSEELDALVYTIIGSFDPFNNKIEIGFGMLTLADIENDNFTGIQYKFDRLDAYDETLSASGNYLALRSSDRITVYNTTDNELLFDLSGNDEDSFYQAEITNDGILFVKTYDYVLVYDCNTKEQLHVVDINCDSIYIPPEFDGTMVYYDSRRDLLAMLTLGLEGIIEADGYFSTKFDISELQGGVESIQNVVYLPDKKIFVSANGTTGSMFIFEPEWTFFQDPYPLEAPYRVLDSLNSVVSYSCISADASIIFGGAMSGKINLYTSEARSPMVKEMGDSAQYHGISSELTAIREDFGSFTIFDLQNESIIANVNFSEQDMPEEALAKYEMSPDGSLALIREFDSERGMICFRILDTATGEIVNYLEPFNEKIGNTNFIDFLGDDDFFMYNFVISDNFKHIAILEYHRLRDETVEYVHSNTLYVYDIENDTLQIKELVALDLALVSVEDTGKKVMAINERNGILFEIDIENDTENQVQSFAFNGQTLWPLGINIENDRITLRSFYDLNGRVVNSPSFGYIEDPSGEAVVYSYDDGEVLFTLSDFTSSDSNWKFSNDLNYAVSFEGSEPDSLWKIPTFEEIVQNTKEFAELKTLTAEERYNSGLSIFDNDWQ